MGILNRSLTGSGLSGFLGTRFGFARCTLAGLTLETGTMTVRETGPRTTVGTTALAGYTYSFAATSTISGSIEGFAAATDANGITGPDFQSNLPPVSVPVALVMTAGGFQIAGTVLLDSLEFATGPNDMNVLKWDWVMVGAPTIRRIYGMTELSR